uniref:(California timema) hypothetical protein n=1 Tax=Timema californicum TaxID=61474 RepID=A0A7R9J9A1_TIMCA|nr:unnamed protein product [Timema californicum]
MHMMEGWRVLYNVTVSDHNLIVLDFAAGMLVDGNGEGKRRCNMSKANWEELRVELILSSPVEQGDYVNTKAKHLTWTLQDALRKSIPVMKGDTKEKRKSWEKYVQKELQRGLWGVPFKIASEKLRPPAFTLSMNDGSTTTSWEELAVLLMETLLPDDGVTEYTEEHQWLRERMENDEYVNEEVEPVSQVEVIRNIALMDKKKAHGPDGINAFSMNIPNLPIQILAVTDTGGANAFFSSDLSHLLITEGNATADRLQAHFMTSTSSCQQKTAFFTPFFKEVWEKKPEIEQAFHMEEPVNLDSGEGTLERPSRHPLPPPRHESYLIKTESNEGSGSEIYERLPTDGSFGDDINEPLSLSFPEDRRLMSPSDDSDIYSNVSRYSHNPQLLPSQRPLTTKQAGSSKKLFYLLDHTPALMKSNLKFTVNRSIIEPIFRLGQEKPNPDSPADGTGSQESMATRDSGWVDESVFLQRQDVDEEMWGTYRQHAFTTGRRHMPALKSRPQGSSQTLKQPGKLNLQEFSLVTETIARMNLGGKDVNMSKHSKPGFGNAPLATPENVDLGSEYAQMDVASILKKSKRIFLGGAAVRTTSNTSWPPVPRFLRGESFFLTGAAVRTTPYSPRPPVPLWKEVPSTEQKEIEKRRDNTADEGSSRGVENGRFEDTPPGEWRTRVVGGEPSIGLVLFYDKRVHPTEIRTLISPSSAVELNTTNALPNYATKAGHTYSDTDSDWSSLDGRQRTVESYCKVNRKQTPHKRIRKKRVIPVATPRVPPTHPLGSLDAAGVLNFQGQEGGCETIDKVCSGTPSDISDVSDPETSQPGRYQKHSSKLKKKCLVKKPILNRGPPLIPSPPALKNSSQQVSALHQQMSSQFEDVFSPLSKPKREGQFNIVHDDESSLEISSPRDVNSPMVSK